MGGEPAVGDNHVELKERARPGMMPVQKNAELRVKERLILMDDIICMSVQ